MQPKIIEYLVISGSLKHVEQNVNHYIDEDYEPFGILMEDSGGTYHQPIVKYGESKRSEE